MRAPIIWISRPIAVKANWGLWASAGRAFLFLLLELDFALLELDVALPLELDLALLELDVTLPLELDFAWLELDVVLTLELDLAWLELEVTLLELDSATVIFFE